MGVRYHEEKGSPEVVVAVRKGVREGFDSMSRRRVRESLVTLA